MDGRPDPPGSRRAQPLVGLVRPLAESIAAKMVAQRAHFATRLIRRPLRDNAVLAEAVFALMAGWAAVRFLPFRTAVRIASVGLRRQAQAPNVERLSRAIEVAAKRVPWRAVCFQQGLALQWMLRRRGIDARLHYGVGYAPSNDLQAHVWVSVGDKIVMGREEAPAFKSVATYPPGAVG